MMKFSEIDKRILHYEEELEYCYDRLNNIINSNKTLQEKFFFDKLKIEFYSFVTY